MKTHVDILIRLNIDQAGSLHAILRQFAAETEGWKFPQKQSEDYQERHDGSAGFVVSEAVDGLERAAVAIAQRDKRRANSFHVPNIVPRDGSSLTLQQHNAIGERFADDLRRFMREKQYSGSLKKIGPEIGLAEIISAPKCRRFFEAWLQTPTPTGHPSDVWLLDRFICAAFQHRAKLNLFDLQKHLVEDRKWRAESAGWAVRRIQTGFDILQVNRKM